MSVRASGGMTQAGCNSLYSQLPTVQNSAPASGATVQMNDTAIDNTLNLSPAATLAALTVNFPTEANSRIGQIIRIGSTKTITLLTLAGATTIFNAIATLAPGDLFSFQKTAANTWQRMQ